MPAVREEIWKPGDGPGLPVVTLETDGARCRIAPQLGLNCLSWEVGGRELLWTSPDIDLNPVPTRSGIPILFPFPNRIRGSRFSWEGKNYQLPTNDHDHKNAIHGFVCFRPWEVTYSDKSVLEARFDSRDFPELRGTWPSEYRCTARYSLPSRHSLCLDFAVENVGPVELPFGLGTHPYWRVVADRAKIRVGRFPDGDAPLQAWVLDDLLPTGAFRPLNPIELKVQSGVELGRNVLDTVLQTRRPESDLRWLLTETTRGHDLMILTGCPDVFQTFVLFTPHHRQAVCIEPYTCTTDAINLQQRGVQAGLLTLPPGPTWQTRLHWGWKFGPTGGAP